MHSGIDDDADMDGLSDDCAPLEARKQRRKHRNRLSAAASRQRKKEWVDALQDQLKLLAAENAALKRRLQSFAAASSSSASSGGPDMDSSRLPPTESHRCKAIAAAKAGAAAGLLAFQAVAAAPAVDAIASDVVLGARLRAHRIEDIVQIMMASEHLAAAAAAATLPPTSALSVKSETSSESSAANSPSSSSAASGAAVCPAKRCVPHQAHLPLHPLCGHPSRPAEHSAAQSCPPLPHAPAADELRASLCAASAAPLVPVPETPSHGRGEAHGLGDADARLGDEGAEEARPALPCAVDDSVGCGASEMLRRACLVRAVSEQPSSTHAKYCVAPEQPIEETARVASGAVRRASGGRDAAAVPLARICAPGPSSSIDGGCLTSSRQAEAPTQASGSPSAKRARRPSRSAKEAAETVAEAAAEAAAEELVKAAAAGPLLLGQRCDQPDVAAGEGAGMTPVCAGASAAEAPAAAAGTSSGGASGPLESLVRALRTLHEAPAPPMKLGGTCRMAKVQ